MKTIDSTLKKVEEKWLQTLFTHCKEIFSHTYLPSHDENHHYRVWCFAKKLIRELARANYAFDTNHVEKIILAVFFHDTGLSVHPGPEHGKYSHGFALDFLNRTTQSLPDNPDEVLKIVEKHDEKGYGSVLEDQSPAPDGLFTMVCVSDDLDAFGITGIYRYAEIYLFRGMRDEDLALQVLENSKARFRYFYTAYGFLKRFAEEHRIRFQILQKFYHDLVLQYKTGNASKTTGPSAVLHHIEQSVLKNKFPLTQLIQEAEKTSKDPYVIDFFRLLQKEMEETMVVF